MAEKLDPDHLLPNGRPARAVVLLSPAEAAVEREVFDTLNDLGAGLASPGQVYPWLLRDVAANLQRLAGRNGPTA